MTRNVGILGTGGLTISPQTLAGFAGLTPIKMATLVIPAGSSPATLASLVTGGIPANAIIAVLQTAGLTRYSDDPTFALSGTVGGRLLADQFFVLPVQAANLANVRLCLDATNAAASAATVFFYLPAV